MSLSINSEFSASSAPQPSQPPKSSKTTPKESIFTNNGDTAIKREIYDGYDGVSHVFVGPKVSQTTVETKYEDKNGDGKFTDDEITEQSAILKTDGNSFKIFDEFTYDKNEVHRKTTKYEDKNGDGKFTDDEITEVEEKITTYTDENKNNIHSQKYIEYSPDGSGSIKETSVYYPQTGEVVDTDGKTGEVTRYKL